jgi:Restriction endonuclease/NACHT domain
MPESGRSALPPGRAFELLVADAYRALGYQVTDNVQLPGKQTDILARREVEGAPSIVLAIECKDEAAAVGSQHALTFISRVITHRSTSIISAGVLVSNSGFTADARAAALDQPYVSLLSWDELSAQVLDVRHQLREVITDYESTPIFHDYVSLPVERLSWSTLASGGSPPTTTDTLLTEWLASTHRATAHSSCLFIVADFGAGKTTLLRRFQYERARAYLSGDDPRVPLFVPLRNFRESQDVPTLVRSSFRDAFYRDVPGDLLWRRIRTGHFYLLLDAFDEMVERSDPDRRVDLFLALLPMLRSPSPTIVTSRPSYFVQQGELEGLLSTLHGQEQEIFIGEPARIGYAPTPADRLQRKLIERHRESDLAPPAVTGPNAVSAVRLLPLGQDAIATLVRRREQELRSAGISPEGLFAFIDRTYDLGDLAKRPLLLTLIIDSAVVGELDLSNAGSQYGVSGLYEMYTATKLAVDLTKGKRRHAGLSSDLRRRLAERVALAMYEDNVLEIDFDRVLHDVVGRDDALHDALSTTGLSRDEIATDFATSSFVTLADDGTCRFIHRSFRGFFVARLLKQAPETNRLFTSDWLEEEVLYFLGGFGPGEPDLADRLWTILVDAPPDAASLRRNALVAYLYTRPHHDRRFVESSTIADATFGLLTFAGTRFDEVLWKHVVVRVLVLTDAEWRDVVMNDVHVGTFRIERGRLELIAIESLVEACELDGADLQIGGEGSNIERLTLRKSRLCVDGDASKFGQVRADTSELRLTTVSESPVLISDMSIAGSRLVLGKANVKDLRAHRSVVVAESPHAGPQRLTLVASVLLIAQSREDLVRTPRMQVYVDQQPSEPDSVVVNRRGITQQVLEDVRCGVFGKVADGVDRLELDRTSAWGILDAGTLLDDETIKSRIPERAPGIGHAGLLVAKPEWYSEAIAPGGLLASVQELERFAVDDEDSARLEVLGKWLGEVLRRVREDYEQALALEWQPWNDRPATLQRRVH